MDTMNLTYLGQCGFLLDFGTVWIVTDPYLSDYVDQTSYSEKTPWKRLYPAPCTLKELEPDAVLISHSHGDHMDPWTLAPYIEAGGLAQIAAPAPECGPLEALGAPHIIYAESETPFTVGRVRVTPIPCAHTELHMDDLGRYRELSYLIECGDLCIFFGGDMSLYPGLAERLAGANIDLLLLPVNGRDEERTRNGIVGNIDCEEAGALAASLNAPYIPMHHDLYAINGATEEEIRLSAERHGANVRIVKPGEALSFGKEKR